MASYVFSHHRIRGSIKRSSERGAVLVEASIVAVVLSIVVFGMLNFGLLLHQANTDSDSVRTAARVAMSTGTTANADYTILQALKTKDVGVADGVNKIVVFKADAADGVPQGDCANFIPVVNDCNVYDAADVDSEAAVTAKSTSWNPSTRLPGTDYIGVRVQSSYNYMTAFFGTTKVFDDTGVIKLQTPVPTSEEQKSGIGNGSNQLPPDGAIEDNQDTNGGQGGGGGGCGCST